MDYVKRAEAYYRLVAQKNIEAVSACLHPDVEFFSPLSTLQGNEAVISAVHNFMQAFELLTIRTTFSESQAMVVYDVDIPAFTKRCPGASLLSYCDGLITRIEVFFDASPFSQ